MWLGFPDKWQWKRDTRLKIGYTTNESECFSLASQAASIAAINQADVLLATSQSASQRYLASPINIPVRVVPLGIDPDEFHYVERKWARINTLKFLLAGVVQLRKGSWLAVEAFLKAFNRLSNVELTIWSTEQPPMYFGLEKEYGKHPKITFDQENKTSSMDVYKEHHVLLSPHLSEGFGLHIPEAMATGMPCIASRCSAPREYFDAEYGWWVEMSNAYIPIGEKDNGFWRLPDVNSLAGCMQRANRHRNICKEKGFRGSVYARNVLNWETTAESIVKIIEERLNGENNIGDSTRAQRGEAVGALLSDANAAC